MSEDLARYETAGVALADSDRLTPVKVEEVKEQIALIRELMASVMKKDEHYGVIPGTQKPTLLKPGAEKLGFTFRLSPRFDIEVVPLERNHRDYRVTCTLTAIRTGREWAQGVGSCSTMESKYRYRHGEPEDTGRFVPGEYWAARKANQLDKAQDILGGKGFITKKIAGQWKVMKLAEGKVENPDIADVFNTVLKMAKKRAHVDAILTATAASDIFTQDVEDFHQPEPEAKPDSPAGTKVAEDQGVAGPSDPGKGTPGATEAPAGDVSTDEKHALAVEDWKRELREAESVEKLSALWKSLQKVWASFQPVEQGAMEAAKNIRKGELQHAEKGEQGKVP